MNAQPTEPLPLTERLHHVSHILADHVRIACAGFNLSATESVNAQHLPLEVADVLQQSYFTRTMRLRSVMLRDIARSYRALGNVEKAEVFDKRARYSSMQSFKYR